MDKIKELFGFKKGDSPLMIALNFIVLIAGGISALARLIYEFIERRDHKK